jgi:hypothetical protein
MEIMMKYAHAFCYILVLLLLSACSQSATAPSEPAAETAPRQTAPETEASDLSIDTPTTTAEMAMADATQSVETPPTPTEIAEAETFFETFGGENRDRGINLLQTNDGGYAIVGYTSSFDVDQEDIYLVRTDSLGQALWSNTYGGEGQDNGWAIMETEDGGFLIVGFSNSFGAGEMDIYLVRTDAGGNMLWERTYGGPRSEYGWDMAPTTDGGYVLAGQTNSFGEGLEDGYLVKVDAQGEELWSQTFGGPQEDRLFSVDQGAGGGFVLTGTTRSFGEGSNGNRDAYLVKTDDSGEQLWMQVFGEDQDDVGHAVRQTDDQGYIVTGYTRSFDAAYYDTWLIKTDETGNSLWQTFYGGPGDDRAIYGEQTDDGGYIATGYTKSFEAVGWDVFLIRTDSSGAVIWHKTFGGRSEDTGYTVKQALDSGFILTGETYSSGEGGGDMVVIKVDRDGEIIE